MKESHLSTLFGGLAAAALGSVTTVVGRASTLADLVQDTLRFLDGDTLRKRVNARIEAAFAGIAGPTVLVAHSQGTLFALGWSNRDSIPIVTLATPVKEAHELIFPALTQRALADGFGTNGSKHWKRNAYSPYDYVGREVDVPGLENIMLGEAGFGHIGYFRDKQVAEMLWAVSTSVGPEDPSRSTSPA